MGLRLLKFVLRLATPGFGHRVTEPAKGGPILKPVFDLLRPVDFRGGTPKGPVAGAFQRLAFMQGAEKGECFRFQLLVIDRIVVTMDCDVGLLRLWKWHFVYF